MRTAAARYEVVDLAAAGAPWITMVHGVSQDRRLFDLQVEAFRAGYRLLLVDLPGHGLSSDLPGPYGLEAFAASLAGALEHAGVTRAHFWGTHLGAAAGLLLASRAPDVFASLVLEAPLFPGRPLPAVNDLLARVCTIARTKGMEAAREAWWREGDWFAVMRAQPERCRAAGQRAIIDGFAGGPWLDEGLAARPIAPIDDLLAELARPVLIMNGAHDLPDFIDAAAALAALLPRCERAVIEEAGGFPLWEFPDRVNQIVRHFLDGVALNDS